MTGTSRSYRNKGYNLGIEYHPGLKKDAGYSKTNLSAQEPSGFIPVRPSLFQNYPNPFNPSTEIQFEILESAHVRLVIYNSLGQEVRTLTDGHMISGSHSVLWDGRDDNGVKLSSGVYFYRIDAGEFTRTKKMINLK